jgi:hypothetical protein
MFRNFHLDLKIFGSMVAKKTFKGDLYIVILVEKEVSHYWKYGYQQYNTYSSKSCQHCRVAQLVSTWTAKLQVVCSNPTRLLIFFHVDLI